MEQVELIHRCQQGDRQAMGLLYTDMHDELLDICRHYVNDSATAEDLLHDSFLLIFSKIGDLRSPEKAHGWMHTVVKNVALLYIQKRKQHNTVSLDELTEQKEMDDVTSNVPSFISYDDLMRYVEALPKGYQQVFRLSVFEGLSHKQIADLLNIEPHSSSSQLFHAKDMLRQSLRMLLLFMVFMVIPVGIYRYMQKEDSFGGKENNMASRNTNKEYTTHQDHDSLDIINDKNVRKKMPMRQAHRFLAHIDTVEQATDKGITEQMAEMVEKEDSVERNAISIHTVEKDEHVTEHQMNPVIDAIHEKSSSAWSIDLAYSGIPHPNHQSLPYGTKDMNGEIDTVVHHRLPMTIALDVRHLLVPRFYVNAGLRYTLLSSDWKIGNTFMHVDREQKVRYLGFSIGASYLFLRQKSWNMYGTLSAMYEVPLHSTQKTTYIYGDKLEDVEQSHLSPYSQWSLGAGVGLQFNLTPHVGLFVEPSVNYYFQRKNDIETWRTLHPFTFSLPLGVRITLP